MSGKITFTDAEIDEAIEYLQGLGFSHSQAIPSEAQTLLIRQAEKNNVSIAVIIHANKSIKYDVSSGGGDEDYPIEIGDINSLEELRLKVAKVLNSRTLCATIEVQYTATQGTNKMALTTSTMLPLGTKAPDFQLLDVVSGETISLSTFGLQQALLVMFICKHCPFVKHIEAELAKLGKDYVDREVGIVAISTNDASKYPDDAPEQLKAMATELGLQFPFCYDESQETAKAYTAACTPDFFLFDAERHLVYRGQLDDSRPSNGKPVTGEDLRAAIDLVLSGRPINSEQKPSVGCNIKWKLGNEPSYYG